MKRKLLQLLLFAIIPGLLAAQEISRSTVNSGGTEYSNESVNFNWTIGQTAINTVSSDEAILTQGFQQNLYSITKIYSDLEQIVEIWMFPNPTDNIVFIEILDDEFTTGTIEIIDINGKIIDIKQISGKNHQLELGHYSSKMFLINIKQNNQILKTYKIIKNQ